MRALSSGKFAWHANFKSCQPVGTFDYLKGATNCPHYVLAGCETEANIVVLLLVIGALYFAQLFEGLEQ